MPIKRALRHRVAHTVLTCGQSGRSATRGSREPAPPWSRCVRLVTRTARTRCLAVPGSLRRNTHHAAEIKTRRRWRLRSVNPLRACIMRQLSQTSTALRSMRMASLLASKNRRPPST